MTNTEKALKHYKAIQRALEECQAGKDVVMFTREAVVALEKQTPKPPLCVYSDELLCPYCREPIEDGDKVCDCGQQMEQEGNR